MLPESLPSAIPMFVTGPMLLPLQPVPWMCMLSTTRGTPGGFHFVTQSWDSEEQVDVYCEKEGSSLSSATVRSRMQ